MLGHPDNYIPANPMVTPAHIVPEWYFLPFYAILRSIPNKLGGVLAMFGAIVVWLLLPIINPSSTRSNIFKPLTSLNYWIIVSNFLILGWIGQQPVEYPFMEIGMFTTLLYFLLFLVIVPFFTIFEEN
jgi:ubiquinol-cytochrome c reductase cytochrome b subunit